MKTLTRLAALGLVAAMLALVGVPAANALNGYGKQRSYSVVVTNLTDNQILTPPVFAAHNQRADIFNVGQPASNLVQEIAENGNLAPLAEALPDVRGVQTSGIGGGEDGPLMPGTNRWFAFDAPRNARLLSTVQMVVCTNDGITGLDSILLPNKKGETVKAYVFAWDAGTEVNTDALSDLVPPCSGGTTGTGTTNPALAEGGVIAPHPGLVGEAAAQWSFDPDQAVAVFEITRKG